MQTFTTLLRFEWLRVTRSPMRVMAVIVFLLCGIYAIASGVQHVKEWRQTLGELEDREQEQRQQALDWFEAGETGPEERRWINITKSLWADRYAMAHAKMDPEPLAALAIGLSDIRSSWAAISATSGSKPFETSDPATLGNAEKLLAGNFDLVFVIAYLMPLLLLVLLFDVGGLERDLGMMRLVRTQAKAPRAWWIQRIALPSLLVVVLVLALCVVGGVWADALDSSFLVFCALACGYTVVWAALFGAVLSAGTGTAAAALWMVGLWLGFCLVVPAAVRQFLGRDHPSLYASEVTTALRSDRYDILLSDIKRHESAFYRARPELSRPTGELSRRTISDMSRLIRQAAFLEIVTDIMTELRNDEIARETAVARFGWLNPAYVLQRALCILAGTESISYREHRDLVLESVITRLEAIVEPQWAEQPIDRAKFESLFLHGPSKRYGQPPEPETYAYLAGLLAASLLAGALLATIRRSRERKTGIV